MRKRSLLLAKSELRNLSYNKAIKHHHQVAFEKLLSDYDFYLGSSHLVAGSAEFELPELVKSNNVAVIFYH
ncbi:MAG: hypothetical protein GY928_01360 [Colwellia sp.]|nr:hypothetical protein [Colwellia sp.]